MKKSTIILFLLILTHSFCFSQTKKPSFEKVLDYYCGKSTSNKLYDTPQNFVYIYSLGLSFNENGLIDTVYFSDHINPITKEIFQLDERKIKIFKSIKIAFKEYANKIVIIPMYHYNMKDSLIDYKSKFLVDFENLFPKIDRLLKPIILHQPVTQGFVRHIN